MFPLISFEAIELSAANELLVLWNHKMGPITRGNAVGWSHALFHEGKPVAVVCTASLIREVVGGGLAWMDRGNTIELGRLCAARPGLCRVALRLWREFVFPSLGYTYAISYQDADLHTGHTYRNDGWKRCGYSRSGTDSRSGRKGRNKWIWVWPPPPESQIQTAA